MGEKKLRQIVEELLWEFSRVSDGEVFSVFLEMRRGIDEQVEGEGEEDHFSVEVSSRIKITADIHLPLSELLLRLSEKGNWLLSFGLNRQNGSRFYDFEVRRGRTLAQDSGDSGDNDCEVEQQPLLRNLVEFFTCLCRVIAAQFGRLKSGEAEFRFEHGSAAMIDVAKGILTCMAAIDMPVEDFLRKLEVKDALHFTYGMAGKQLCVKFNGSTSLQVMLPQRMALGELLAHPASD